MAPFPIDRVVDHVLHACEVAGPEHVALGSDFDGIERRPLGLEGAEGFPALEAALASRGVSAGDRAAILGGQHGAGLQDLDRRFLTECRPSTSQANRADSQGRKHLWHAEAQPVYLGVAVPH